MAKSLKNFIVGIGADTTKFKEGVTDVNSSLNGMRSIALRTGGAMVGSLVAVGAHALTTARDVDQLAGKMQYSDADIQYFYNYGNAVARMGGDANTAHGELMSLQKALNAFQRQGDRGTLEQLAIATGSGETASRIINMTNDLNVAQRNLADVVAKADNKQKLRIQEVLGLDDATMRLLEKGSMGVDIELKISQTNTGNIDQLTASSRELVSEWETLKQNVTGFGNEIAQSTIPAMTDLLRSTNEVGASVGEWYRHARDFLSVNANDAVDFIAKDWSIATTKANDFLFSGSDKDLERGNTVTQHQIDMHRSQRVMNELQSGITPPKPDQFQQIQNFSNRVTNEVRSQPIQVNNSTTITVELDGRKVGEAVTDYQETQNFIYQNNTMSTTGR